jgi:hypothetical protein
MATTSNDLNISQPGYVAFDGLATFTGRTFQAGTGINLTNPDGISGNTTISSTASLTDLHVAKWIVNPAGTAAGGNQLTIAAAIAAASSGDTIFITPGIYTENLTLKAGVNLVAFDCDSLTPNVTINGTCTFTTAGTVSISGIRLQTNSSFFLAVTGSAASIVNLTNCYLNASNNTGISYSTSNGAALINMYSCKGNIGTTGISLFSMSSTGGLTIYHSVIGNSGNSTTASTISDGAVIFFDSMLSFPLTSSGTTAGFTIIGCQIEVNNTTVILHGSTSSGATIQESELSSGSASCISVSASATLNLKDSIITSSNTNAITGAGTLNYGTVIFTGSSSTVNTTTQNGYALSTIQGGTGLTASSTSGNVLTSNGTIWTSTAPAASSLITTFTTPGTSSWTIDPRTKIVEFFLWGGGGGGGSGRSGASSLSIGGSGGGGGGFTYTKTFASLLTASPYTTTVGAAGTGGGSVNGTLQDGNPGINGGTTSVGSAVLAQGGIGGVGGTTSAGVGGASRYTNMLSGLTTSATGAPTGAGGSNTPTAAPAFSYAATTGGGGGAGYRSATPTAGSNGGNSLDGTGATLIAGGLGQIGNAGNGNSPVSPSLFVGGTGGGGGGNDGTTTAGNGGNGAAPAGGGGGGGGNLSTNATGAGGNGADGKIIIIEYF